MTKLKSWSFSSLQEYEQCPRKYQLKRVTKECKEPQSQAMLDGNVAHKQLELRVAEGTPLPDRLAHMEPFCKTIDARREAGDTILVETEIVLNNRMEQTTWWAPDAWYRGKIDVGFIHGDHALLADHKTGKRKAGADQLKLFAATAFTAFGSLEKITTAYIWLKEGKIDKEVFFRSDADDIWADFLGRLRRLEYAMDTDTWPCKPSGLCPYCPATSSQCSFSRR